MCEQKSFIFCICQNAWILTVNKQKKIRMKFYFICLLRLPRYASERINLMELVYPVSQASGDICLKHYIPKLFSYLWGSSTQENKVKQINQAWLISVARDWNNSQGPSWVWTTPSVFMFWLIHCCFHGFLTVGMGVFWFFSSIGLPWLA